MNGDPIDPDESSEHVDPAGDAHREFIERQEERLAAQRASAIAAGKRKGGLAGAAMAGAMFAVADIVEGPRKDDKPVTVEASDDPNDLDKDGIDVRVGEVDVSAPPLERVELLDPKHPGKRTIV